MQYLWQTLSTQRNGNFCVEDTLETSCVCNSCCMVRVGVKAFSTGE